MILRGSASMCSFRYNGQRSDFSPPLGSATGRQAMPDQTVGIGPQDRAERERFESEVHRIVEAGDVGGVSLRLLGSLAFHSHCPKFGYLQEKMNRATHDIDLAGYSREAAGIRGVMQGLGYAEHKEVFVVSEGGRAIFENPKLSIHVDVFSAQL